MGNRYCENLMLENSNFECSLVGGFRIKFYYKKIIAKNCIHEINAKKKSLIWIKNKEKKKTAVRKI